MTDMKTTIIPKSDQLNADDLIGRTLTIKVTKVSLLAGEQPVAINYEGDNGKPYKPCKSMRRVLVMLWGDQGGAYVGRSMTLYRDEKVTFGGAAVGGIRISHMTGIDEPRTMALTASKANRKPFTVKPLIISGAQTTAGPTASTGGDGDIDALKSAGRSEAAKGLPALEAWWKGIGGSKQKLLVGEYLDEIKKTAAKVTPPANASTPGGGDDDQIPL